MNEIFMSPVLALAVAWCIFFACLYVTVLALYTLHTLPKHRTVARAIAVLIALVGLMDNCTGTFVQQQLHGVGPFQLAQVVEVLRVMIYVLILRLLVKPCSPEPREIA